MGLIRNSIYISALLMLVPCVWSEDFVYCDSVPMRFTDWTYNSTLSKFDPAMGKLTGVDIHVNYNLTHRLRAENLGDSNSTLNSSIQSVLEIEAQGMKPILANASLILSKMLPSFDGTNDYAGSSGVNLTESSSSGTVKQSYSNISDFQADGPGDKLQLNLSTKSTPKLSISGDIGSQVRTMAEANICIYYHYDPRGGSDVE